jgi:hypothetical protein
MVSLLELSEVTEKGVKFQSPYDGSECMMTPEHSIEIQNTLGADIIMQLDDVVSSTVTGPRVEEAMHRFSTVKFFYLFIFYFNMIWYLGRYVGLTVVYLLIKIPTNKIYFL